MLATRDPSKCRYPQLQIMSAVVLGNKPSSIDFELGMNRGGSQRFTGNNKGDRFIEVFKSWSHEIGKLNSPIVLKFDRRLGSRERREEREKKERIREKKERRERRKRWEEREERERDGQTDTHTHTQTYRLWIYICKCSIDSETNYQYHANWTHTWYNETCNQRRSFGHIRHFHEPWRRG